MKHQLKIEPQYFQQVLMGNKNFEIRNNDRNFKVGDLVDLNEIGTDGKISCIITFVTNFKQKDGYVVFGIKVFK